MFGRYTVYVTVIPETLNNKDLNQLRLIFAPELY